MAQPTQSKRDVILVRLNDLAASTEDWDGDPEDAHMKADALLLDLIDDDEVSQAFREIRKWYV